MPLEIYLLGQFKMTDGNQAIDLPSRPAQSLLAYLAIHPGVKLRREKLASLLWPDSPESSARGYLRQALWRIRKSLDSGSLRCEQYLEIGEIDITFLDPPDAWVDVAQFLRPTAGLSLEEVIAQAGLYRGEFLPGFYDEWISLERDRIQAACQQKMEQLLNILAEQARWQDVLTWGEEWLRLGAAAEPAYQAMMKAHARLGSQAMVGVTYQRCKEALRRDLDVDVSPETERLYKQLQRGQSQEQPQPARQAQAAFNQPPFLGEQYPGHSELALVVAREQELARMESALDLALNEQGQVIFITGEAGSGKTTLVGEFARRARLANASLVFASGGCNAHTGIGDPCLPFREILELVTGDVEARWRAGALTREEALFLWNLIPVSIQALMDTGPGLLDTFVSSTGLYERAAAFGSGRPDLKARFERLLESAGAAGVARSLPQTELFIQYCKVLQNLSRKAPLVLFIDDLQWADLGSISLLFHLGRHLPGSRILVVGAYRPEEVALGRDGERHPLEQVVNELRRAYGDLEINLDQSEGRAYIDALLDSEPNRLGRQFREMLASQTRGHPLFTIELLRGMQEHGAIVNDEQGRWVEGSNLNWEKLPARVEAVIAERIGRLDPALQSILRAASVEGELFTAEVIARVHNLSKAEIYQRLNSELDRKHRLVRAQSIQRVGSQLLSSYRFRHFLVQKFLYGSQDEVERIQLHEQIGDILEGLYQPQPGADAISLQLARHFEEARNLGKAVHYLLQSGVRALLVSAYQDAILHLQKGLALIADLPDRDQHASLELALLSELSTALHMSTGLVGLEAENTTMRAYQMSRQIGNTAQLGKILSGLSLFAYIKGELPAALDYAGKVFDLGREFENPLLIDTSHWFMGITYYQMGVYQEARRHLELVVTNYDPRQHKSFILFRGVDIGLSAMAYLTACLWCLGYPDQALALRAKTLGLASEIGHAFSLADVLRYACCELAFLRRDAQSLKEDAQALIQLSQEKQLTAWVATGTYSLGEAYLLMGLIPEGMAMLQEGVRAEIDHRVHVSLPGPLCFLAEVYERAGDVVQGLKVWNESIQMVERTSARHWEAEHYRVLALLQRAQGDAQAAEGSLMKAIEIARRQSSPSWELRSALSLAKLWRGQGRRAEGCQLVQAALAGFREGFDTPEYKEAVEFCGA